MDDTIKISTVKRSFTELNYIINNMSKSLQDKIPEDLKQYIIEQMDTEYMFNVDVAKKYTEQNYMPETKIFLSVLLSEYIGNEIIKSKWNIFDKEYLSLKYQKEADNNVTDVNIFNNEVKDIDKSREENNKLAVIKKDSIFKKICKKIMQFFKKY